MASKIRSKVKRMVSSGVSYDDIAKECKIPSNTVKTWVRRYRWKAQSETIRATKTPKPIKAEWMQCFMHDNAHLVKKNGEAVCSTAAKPVSGIIGRNWHPWDGVTKCTRCMGWESKNVIKGQESSSQKA